VDAFPARTLRGHVKTVATVASQQDWMSADVRVYQCYVSIDESLEGMRPDMSAEVTILTDRHREHVLTIPLQAVVGSVEMGNKRKCYVDNGHGTEERVITLGMSNSKMVEVKEGLQEGELVVINPRSLMSDKEKAAAGAPPKGEGGPGEGQGSPGAGGTDKKGSGGPGGADGERKGPRMKKGPGGPPSGAEGQ
jgi:multidrug efflux pump subunit AcrA (membrane-fusion protein)